MTINAPFLARFAEPIKDFTPSESKQEDKGRGSDIHSAEARGETRHTKVSNETTDDE